MKAKELESRLQRAGTADVKNGQFKCNKKQFLKQLAHRTQVRIVLENVRVNG
jgi:hypothetical protein